jgi:hypothetical protein
MIEGRMIISKNSTGLISSACEHDGFGWMNIKNYEGIIDIINSIAPKNKNLKHNKYY